LNVGILIGKANSVGVPGKNTRMILGRPSVEYSFIAAQYSKIDRLFVSTDCPIIKSISKKYDCTIINRPSTLAKRDTPTEDVLFHAYEQIKIMLKGNQIDTITILFSNTPCIDVDLLNYSITRLRDRENIDSIFSVAKYDMFSPVRARKLSEDGLILPTIDLDLIGNVSSLRGTEGSTYFQDFSIQVLKERCLQFVNNGKLPFKWQGLLSEAVETDFGFDIDTEWQIPVIEYWLKKRGFTENEIPWKT
jgi:hypothetical protein